MTSLFQKILHFLKKEQLDINMRKVSKRQFELFKKECKKWIDIFELNNWNVAYMQNKTKKSFAYCHTNVTHYKATIHLCKVWDDEVVKLTDENIKKTALHEILHLLLSRLSDYGYARFVADDEMTEAEEELVNKLINVFHK